MTNRLERFNEIYESTYYDILGFIIKKCYNTNDVNDILQETYLELWKIINTKNIDITNSKSFVIGIAINKIKKYHTIIGKIKTISLFSENSNNIELIDTLETDVDIEEIMINIDEWTRIWNYIKKKKNQDIPKIFYLHYKLELSIKEISLELNIGESYVKNLIYRTFDELYSIFGKENKNDK